MSKKTHALFTMAISCLKAKASRPVKMLNDKDFPVCSLRVFKSGMSPTGAVVTERYVTARRRQRGPDTAR